ncbi:Crp/Fnr family transcriptional regulator [Acidovorax sp. DW039]|uniref:Crp/Fnr family transcriptional regulator n=1 Tax=Acidovorax sp. DW039 TaxID=3095606 RepID=UPI003087785B|nr:Crp/Fnr family transcriptional regulator [Acidovorax sp. DW039]
MKISPTSLPLVKNKLSRSIWFSNWNDLQIDKLLAGCEVRHFSKSDLVYSDDARENLVFVLSGSVWTCLRNEAEVVKFGIAYPSTLIGLSQLAQKFFHDEPKYEFYAVDEVEVLSISAKVLLGQLESSPVLWKTTAEAAIVYQRHCIKLALVLYAGAIRDRLISAIYQFGLSAAKHGARVPDLELSIQQEELAVLIQSSRQHVNKALRDLEQDGLISIGYKKIIIKDPERIEIKALARFSSK